MSYTTTAVEYVAVQNPHGSLPGKERTVVRLDPYHFGPLHQHVWCNIEKEVSDDVTLFRASLVVMDNLLAAKVVDRGDGRLSEYQAITDANFMLGKFVGEHGAVIIDDPSADAEASREMHEKVMGWHKRAFPKPEE